MMPARPKWCWNERFRAYSRRGDEAIVFSKTKILAISGVKFHQFLKSFRSESAGKVARKYGPLWHALVRSKAIAKTNGTRLRRRPIGSSFVSLRTACDGLPSVITSLAKRAVSGPDRILLQLREDAAPFGSQLISYCSGWGLARQTDQYVTFSASGAGLTIDHALVRTLGEAVERYSLASFDRKSATLCRRKELTGPILDPALIVSFDSDEQSEGRFGCVPYSDEYRFQWIRALDLFQKRAAFLPAQFTYVPCPLAHGEPRLWQANTSGVAAARSFSKALEGAILELIERDAVMLAWFGRAETRRIVGWQAVMPEMQGVVEQTNLKALPFRLKNEFDVPVALVLTVSADEREPHFTVGSAAGWTWQSAIGSALIEALQNRIWLRKARYNHMRRPNQVRDPVDHALFYANRSNAGAFDWLMKQRTVDLAPLKGSASHRELQILLKKLKESHYSVWLVDVSSQFARAVGYHVIRAFVPGLIPVQFGHNVVAFGMPRLRSALERLPPDRMRQYWPHPIA